MKPLDLSDFRACRLTLEPDTFAIGPDEPDPPPSDLIDRETWQSTMSLPDDVSIRTSNEYGKTLKTLWFYWSEWNCLCGALHEDAGPPKPSPVAYMASDAADELQASIFCAVTGYYRVAFSCLRNVIEQMTVALQLELSGDLALFQSWLNGQEELGLGWAADFLPRENNVSALENWWSINVFADLFSQKRKYRPGGGFVRRLFSELSEFTHGGPGFTDADMRQSNGPIFVKAAYERWLNKFTQVYAVGILAAQIASPGTKNLAFESELTSRTLFDAALTALPPDADGLTLLASMPPGLW
jgi:hypothetical protein